MCSASVGAAPPRGPGTSAVESPREPHPHPTRPQHRRPPPAPHRSACRGWPSTTSTAAPTPRARCARTAAAFDDVIFRPRSAVATTSVRPARRRCSGRRSTCPSCSRRWAAAACSTRAAKRWRRARRARQARRTSCQRCRGAASATSRLPRADRSGTSSTSSAGATCARRRDRACEGRRVLGARRHHRHAGGRHARARLPQRHEGAPLGQPADDAPVPCGSSSRGHAGSRPTCATAA